MKKREGISSSIQSLCALLNVSVAELARITNQSPQNLNSKLNRESFTVEELNDIANGLGVEFVYYFQLPTGEHIK